MKMNYLLKSKTNHEYRFKNVLIVLFFAVLGILISIFPVGIKNIFNTIAKPIWSIGDFSKNSFGNIYSFFSLQNNLVLKNKNLEEQVNTLNMQVVDYDAVLKENQDLKAMYGRKNDNERILARVLSKPPQSPYDTLVVDTGLNYDIKVGDMVYMSDNIIVGEVVSVTSNTSMIQLFSSGDRRTQITLERTGATYEVIGQGGANFTIEAPKDADILWGDVFTYPGIVSSVIGSVYYIDSNSQSSFKTIFIKIPGNIFQSKWVFIEKTV